jgi:hypothetical protein
MKSSPLSALTLTVALGLAGAAIAGPAPAHFKGDKLSGLARVSLDQARAIALKARPGAVTDQELEKEHGGSGLRYSFDIADAGKSYEVGVDAKTGRVLENGQESARAEAAEVASERHRTH